MKQDCALDQPAKSYLGICIGSSTVSCVRIGSDNGRIHVLSSCCKPHHGDPKGCLASLLSGDSNQTVAGFAVVRRTSVSNGSIPILTEPEALEYAYEYVAASGSECDAIVSAGGEVFFVYRLDRTGHIARVFSGNKCASGTGEFFLQQIRRMNLSVDEATDLAVSEPSPYKVSGRCSVFCKSDCTHALNKGASKQRVVAGLCEMMAGKIVDLLKQSGCRRPMLVGGVARNRAVVEMLHREFPQMIVPDEAPWFEALGAALYASRNGSTPDIHPDHVFPYQVSSFELLPPLSQHTSLVTFLQSQRGELRADDECILGLDVGSTTTKAVLLRIKDNAIVAAVYLRTDGDPVEASRKCYAELAHQVGSVPHSIVGLGTTGSGRYIAGLHALTPSVINEITAHATAARFIDTDVETVFEIGGQDAKYTYLVNGVATDYAMNEACSAGTGSFLEEAAGEHLKIPVDEIAPLALRATQPLNFSDECAAFIASDINTAIHEGFAREDILAGIVYSICMNYLNRVKQNRPAGRTILMQGGVCYNRSVPLAMAGLTGQHIIVPPEPGLMGAFGVALEVKKRLELGLLERDSFSLNTLAARELKQKAPFICRGGKDQCDRKCEIARIEIEGKTYPFGGSCRKYENLRLRQRYDSTRYDHVTGRTNTLFHIRPAAGFASNPSPLQIGINNSFLMHTYFPLFSTFFTSLGMEVILPDSVDPESAARRGAAFCYPMEAAHGTFGNLIDRNPNFYFLPMIRLLPYRNNGTRANTCVFVQSESSVLPGTFADRLPRDRILRPTLDLSHGLSAAEDPLLAVAKKLGVDKRTARRAFREALAAQESYSNALVESGAAALAEVESDPSQFAVVLFGRPYNAFTPLLNMGIPHRLASQGIHVIPFDSLPCRDEPSVSEIYWGIAHDILQAANVVCRHPQLFGVFITNFSCGPDAFILGYFRDIMGDKPSLTLELDSHTADVGIDTRIEAFLDIVNGYRRIHGRPVRVPETDSYRPASIIMDGKTPKIRTSSGETLSITHPRVRVVVPEMGEFNSAGLAASLRGFGIRATMARIGIREHRKGRECGTCKECLPYQLTTGSLLSELETRQPDEVLLFFMPKSHGPCRQGQYTVALDHYIQKRRLRDVAILSLDDNQGFEELGTEFVRLVWRVLLTTDLFEDIRNLFLAIAVDRQSAVGILHDEFRRIQECIASGACAGLDAALEQTANRLRSVPLTMSPEEAPKIRLLGEVFARGNSFSRRGLVQKLADRGFVVTVAPLAEYIYFCDYIRLFGYSSNPLGNEPRVYPLLRILFKQWIESKIRRILSRSNLLPPAHPSVRHLMKDASHFLNPYIVYETMLSVGLGIHEILDEVCGVISIGPFGCLPSRVTEAVFEFCMNVESKKILSHGNHTLFAESGMTHLPALAIETDGRSMSHITEAKLNTFCLQAMRVHKRMKACETRRTYLK
ncbi:MAG TPA: acyl-CoA dehydratase activase [bacterium]|nr:acyl-CoA dehydratase activase [bacterium]